MASAVSTMLASSKECSSILLEKAWANVQEGKDQQGVQATCSQQQGLWGSSSEQGRGPEGQGI